MDTRAFGEQLSSFGFTFYSGVPCSFLKYLINYAINELDYVAAANEGDAVAISVGARLGGRKSVVMMQNSGLTNATSPLTSLTSTFKVPVLGFVSLRGEEGLGDEPQHELMGRITGKLLDDMEITWEYLEDDLDAANIQLERANACIESGKTFFFVVKKGTFSTIELTSKPFGAPSDQRRIENPQLTPQRPTRVDCLNSIMKQKDDTTIVLATTGKTGRELYEVEDASNHLYMVGSMGCISSLGLGLALARPDVKVIVIDGDGSLLMRMGSLATNAFYNPNNLLHVLLDNNTHDSTGGQLTVSHNLDFGSIASSCGYPNVIYSYSAPSFEGSIHEWKQTQELTFLYLKTAKGSKPNLGRPTIKPFEVAERLMGHLSALESRNG